MNMQFWPGETRFWPGETVRVSAAFTDINGAGIAATGVEVTVKPPQGSLFVVSAIAGSETGIFYADVVAAISGVWAVRITCSGPTASAVEEQFTVAPSLVL